MSWVPDMGRDFFGVAVQLYFHVAADGGITPGGMVPASED